MASEVGVLDIAPENVLAKGRLQPGRMFLVDLAEGRIIADEELKAAIAHRQPYQRWLDESLTRLDDLPAASSLPRPYDEAERLTRQQAFGYTIEDLKFLMSPMALNGQEAVGSMGTDTPLAVLSNKPQLLFNYFKQLFAQVTNPPIDPIREELVMSLKATIGCEENLFEEGPEHCRQLELEEPVIDDGALAKIAALERDEASRRDAFRCCIASTTAAPASRRRSRCSAGRPRSRSPTAPPARAHRSRHGRRNAPHPEPARDGSGPPSPDPERQPHALRARDRVGRAARGATLRAAGRLRRGAINPYLAIETCSSSSATAC
jgi:hypothetical protein